MLQENLVTLNIMRHILQELEDLHKEYKNNKLEIKCVYLGQKEYLEFCKLAKVFENPASTAQPKWYHYPVFEIKALAHVAFGVRLASPCG